MKTVELRASICRCFLSTMGQLFRGYFIVCMSPLISLALFPLWRLSGNWFLDMVMLILIQLSVISIQVLGLALCFVGIRKNEQNLSRVSYMIPGILLILWGCFTIWFALELHRYLIVRSSWNQVSLTVWEHLQYAMWAFKGLLWVLAGAIFTATSYIKRTGVPFQETSEDEASMT